jgi:8-oxo-dGTP diphosphatase
MMVTFATLCYLHQGNRVLLQQKARGRFGEGGWNAPGGKMRNGESPEKGAAREMLEETGLRVHALTFSGVLNFYLGESRKLDQIVFLFSCKKSTGRMRRSNEGELKWFTIESIPYNEMWDDDRIWLPQLLNGNSFVGDFYFSENYKKLERHKIHEATRTSYHGQWNG